MAHKNLHTSKTSTPQRYLTALYRRLRGNPLRLKVLFCNSNPRYPFCARFLEVCFVLGFLGSVLC